MEELIEQIAGNTVEVRLPSFDGGLTFNLIGYLYPRYGHPSGYKMVFWGGQSELWFKLEAVHLVDIEQKIIVLKVLKGISHEET